MKLTLAFRCQDAAVQTPCLVAVAVTEGVFIQLLW